MLTRFDPQFVPKAPWACKFRSGSLVDGVGSCTSLRYFDIAWNDFSGVVPDAVATMRRLHGFYAHQNRLDGSLPSSFGLLSMDGLLDVSRNNFFGSLPALGGVRGLALDANHFSGSVPSGSKWPGID